MQVRRPIGITQQMCITSLLSMFIFIHHNASDKTLAGSTENPIHLNYANKTEITITTLLPVLILRLLLLSMKYNLWTKLTKLQ